VDLDDEVTDSWGLPVARITLTPHENDLAQGPFLVDRCGKILEAAGGEPLRHGRRPDGGPPRCGPSASCCGVDGAVPASRHGF
jgi:hypothetical protein